MRNNLSETRVVLPNSCPDSLPLLEQGAMGIAFGILLCFVLRQYKQLMDQLGILHTTTIQVIEKNTQAQTELRQAFDRLNQKLSVV